MQELNNWDVGNPWEVKTVVVSDATMLTSATADQDRLLVNSEVVRNGRGVRKYIEPIVHNIYGTVLQSKINKRRAKNKSAHKQRMKNKKG